MYKLRYKPKVLMTDGFSVSVLFAQKVQKSSLKSKKPKRKKKNATEEKIDLSTLNQGNALTSGIFDADNIKCSSKYLEKYHKKGIDSGNQYMITQVSEADRSTIITKKYYNEISHINLNKRKQDKLLKDCDMNKIYAELSETPRTTTNYEEYNKYVLIVRKYNKKIWEFYGRKDIRGLKYDTYVNKRAAICKIVRELVPSIREDKTKVIRLGGRKKKVKIKKKGKHKGEHRKHKKDAYFNAEVHKKTKDKPTMIAFGKGNGSLTINNTKGTSAHGPIKRIITQLSKVCVVILTNEDYSSQMCCKCEEKLIHPKVIEDISNKKKEDEEKKAEKDKKYVTRMKRIEKGREIKEQIKKEKKKKEKKRLEDELAKLKVEYECYKLCCCKNKECGHKLWHRDTNAAKNMITIMTRTLTEKPLGVFEKK